MYTMQTILPFIKTTSISPIFRRPKDANVNVSVVQSGQFDFAEEMQTVCCYGHANGFEILGGEGCEVAVGEVGDGAEVFGFVL